MDHTIILRTRNRPVWLLACLKFYCKIKYSGVLLIADDSDGCSLKQNHENIKLFKALLNIDHVLGDYKHLSNRVARVVNIHSQVLRSIKTTYFSLSSDDDVCLASTYFDRARSFLDKNPDFIAVDANEIKVYFDFTF